MRLTAKRKQILDVLHTKHGTFSAADISDFLPDMDLTTIYRNLDLFTSQGLIKQYNFNNSESVYEYQSENHHHALCLKCKKVLHFKAPDQKVIDLLCIGNFDVESLEITVRGDCCCGQKV